MGDLVSCGIEGCPQSLWWPRRWKYQLKLCLWVECWQCFSDVDFLVDEYWPQVIVFPSISALLEPLISVQLFSPNLQEFNNLLFEIWLKFPDRFRITKSGQAEEQEWPYIRVRRGRSGKSHSCRKSGLEWKLIFFFLLQKWEERRSCTWPWNRDKETESFLLGDYGIKWILLKIHFCSPKMGSSC